MTRAKFEQILGEKCSPVLMGVKPANLVSFSRLGSEPLLSSLVREYAEKLLNTGIRMDMFCGCRGNYLLLVYTTKMLADCLGTEEACRILTDDGYPSDASLAQMLDILKGRFHQGGEFPHEIGLFLGYPPEDVEGFRRYKGAGCKFCGYWKVYGDVDKARRLFASYDRCKSYMSGQFRQGRSLMQALDLGNKEELRKCS